MKTKKYFSLFLFALSFSGLSLSNAQQSEQCLAVITEINGEVFVREATKSEFVKTSWGTQLFKGDEIKTSVKSEVKLLFSNSSLITLGANSSIKISGKESPSTEKLASVKNLSSAAMVNLSGLTLKREDKKDVGALADLRSGTEEQAIELRSPYITFIKTNRPSFSWITKKSYDRYTVNLYSSKGLVWSRKVSESTLMYPENEKGLEFGETYFWNVEGEFLIESDKSGNRKFTVLTLDKSKEVEQNEILIRNSFTDDPESSSLHSVLGAYYINQGLLQDAIAEFQIIAKINTDAALPHEILGSLYSDTGNKDEAIEELQKALALAKK